MFIGCAQLGEEKKKNKERDADLPSIPGGSLGSFKNGLQSLPLRVSAFVCVHRRFSLCFFVCVSVCTLCVRRVIILMSQRVFVML
jgi:hypothetical protein